MQNDTNNKKTKDEYVHMITYVLVIYIYTIMYRLTRTTMRYIFGNGVGRHNATEIRESSPWGQLADMMVLEWSCGYPELRPQQERQRLLEEGERKTQATG